ILNASSLLIVSRRHGEKTAQSLLERNRFAVGKTKAPLVTSGPQQLTPAAPYSPNAELGMGDLNSFRIPHSESHAPTFQTYVRIFGAGFDVSLRHYQNRVMANGVPPLNH